MSNADFSTTASAETLAHEVTCLKAMVTLLLKAIGQADAGKVIINMERYIAQLEDAEQAAVFDNTIKQIKTSYRK
ncbi:DUF2594 family protein [Pectobacterium brasiliense]|uniref:DUF2594 family protein n=1 Tax=Pectobacterium brasiliense TaxID=180957 RepID=A0A433N6Y5_9GAMM|nr:MULTISPECIES: DUF2594 family protein [Pectobacterium]AFR04139.1 hypothetical protein PCC21_027360 [Pectobacterium carotovorum subsp. carotovorum PCC21]APS30724.1 hypothetical protein NC16_13740 [Pectobacterium brasiliense]ARA75850.1 hypothetical protein B5S52_08190 [Pectobacterium brasiliense]ATV42094.1 hypothetical protein CTV95_00910 [Pectobacterium brasiliense]KFF64937.1 hypothetical protein IV99_12315 [Pectobacterium brasiliense]